MLSVDVLCPACKRPLAAHLPSRRRAPADVPVGKVAVVNGRCIVAGERAPQKCCWVALGEPMTLDEYRERFEAETIPLEPCPCCGGRLNAWGSFPRTLVEGEAGVAVDLELLRGRCPNPECPVCTVTHYPSFVTPYATVSTGEREAAVRAHLEPGKSWSGVSRSVPWSLCTVQRWERRLARRAAEVLIGLLGVWQVLDHRAPTEVPSGETRSGLLRAMFRVADAVAGGLRSGEGWTAPLPGLAVPRLFRPRAPTTLPVWT
jgi:hypothetical protein